MSTPGVRRPRPAKPEGFVEPHAHHDADDGGLLDAVSIPTPALGSGTADSTTVLHGDRVFRTPAFPPDLVTSVHGRTGDVVGEAGDYTVAEVTGAAPLASPAFTGNPTAPTPVNPTSVSTKGYVDGAVAAEASARSADVDAEESARMAADAALDSAITAETSARVAADAALDSAKANVSHVHAAGDITTGVLAAARGGTELSLALPPQTAAAPNSIVLRGGAGETTVTNLTADKILIGSPPPITGGVRLANTQKVVSRKVSGGADVDLIHVDTANNLVVGGATAENVILRTNDGTLVLLSQALWPITNFGLDLGLINNQWRSLRVREITGSGYARAVPAISSGTLTLDYRSGPVYDINFNQNITTLSITNVVATGVAGEITLRFTSDGSVHTVAWPAGWLWGPAGAPTLSSVVGQVDLIRALTADGGTTWTAWVLGLGY